ncbi:hypothetical protein PUN28_008514 [Cardiocondyla obscurior]|uniref:Uncharacterized protein n=1 Tax=Cardiocondyla obscurior TaxID=286306 RepID=A0AAW2G1G0_9HYME
MFVISHSGRTVALCGDTRTTKLLIARLRCANAKDFRLACVTCDKRVLLININRERGCSVPEIRLIVSSDYSFETVPRIYYQPTH